MSIKFHNDFDQNSVEWLKARAGVITASEFDNLITPKGEPKKGQGPESYLALKLAERWLGPLPSFHGIDMEFGSIREDRAIPFYELKTGQEIQRVAFITNEEETIGCSPDGLIGDDGGIEIKCPEPKAHFKYLLQNKVPDDYYAQVQGSMFVTGRKWWKFLSYRSRCPELLLHVEPDEGFQNTLEEILPLFVARLDRSFSDLCERYGGPPRDWRQPVLPVTPTYKPHEFDVVP